MEFGIDRLPTQTRLLSRLRAARVGVLAHAASVDRRLVHLVDLLGELAIGPRVLFGPEHGFAGAAQDMASVGDARDARHDVRVVSLYGDELDDLVPKPADLGDIDVLLVDLVDVGARYYTFVWTALLALRAAAEAGVHVVFLDRPNPIGGLPESVEGKLQRPGYTSFVGWEAVPIRHALTLAEMVLLHAAADGLPLGPDGVASAVGVVGWDRAEMATRWDRPFVLPSPNMPTPDTALVYPGGCLLEGTNLSEGRGHTRPFEIVGAPFLDGELLALELGALGLPGFIARPVGFIPTFHKHAGQLCHGVQIHVTDSSRFRPVATYAALVALAWQQAPDACRFRTERYEFVDHIPAFDLLTGSAETRKAIERGEDPRAIADALAAPDPGWPTRMRDAQRALAAASW